MASPVTASSWRKQHLHKKMKAEEQKVGITPNVVVNNFSEN